MGTPASTEILLARHAGGRGLRVALQFSPVAIAGLFVLLLFFLPTREFAKTLLLENHVVENITFAAFLLGAVLGAAAAIRSSRSGQHLFVTSFYTLVSAALFVIAMEEVNWGQLFIEFETPAIIRKLTTHREMSIHKRHLIDGQSEYLRMIVCVGMWLGLLPWRSPQLRKIAMPRFLWPWPFVITILCGIDLYTVFVQEPRFFYRTMGIYMSEVTEMLIGLAAFLYVAVNLRRLSLIENRQLPGRT